MLTNKLGAGTVPSLGSNTPKLHHPDFITQTPSPRLHHLVLTFALVCSPHVARNAPPQSLWGAPLYTMPPFCLAAKADAYDDRPQPIQSALYVVKSVQ